jgi:hypothetical protein
MCILRVLICVHYHCGTAEKRERHNVLYTRSHESQCKCITRHERGVVTKYYMQHTVTHIFLTEFLYLWYGDLGYASSCDQQTPSIVAAVHHQLLLLLWLLFRRLTSTNIATARLRRVRRVAPLTGGRDRTTAGCGK